MNPIRSLKEVIENWDIFEGRWRSLYAFFLYTNEDRNIARYVREYFHELDKLSGKECLIFLIDNPPRTWEEESRIRDYWKEFTFRTRVWEGFKKVMPYDRSKAYEIAEFLGIPPRLIPCIVFFRSIDEREILFYPLDSSWSDERLTKEFRELFSAVRGKCENINDDNERKKQIWKNLKRFIRRRSREQIIVNFINHPIARSVGDVFRRIFRLL